MSKGDWIAERKRRQKIDKVGAAVVCFFAYVGFTLIACLAVLYIYRQIS